MTQGRPGKLQLFSKEEAYRGHGVGLSVLGRTHGVLLGYSERRSQKLFSMKLYLDRRRVG